MGSKIRFGCDGGGELRMLVYGDVETACHAADRHAAILADLRSLLGKPAGLERHGRLVAAFVDSGDLIRALIDRDAPSDLEDASVAAMHALTALANCVDLSWTSGFAGLGDLPSAIAQLERLRPRGPVLSKPAEGYSFYALYPETYAEAARRSGLPPGTMVIGIRSIGASLAAMVTVGLGAATPVTVRPTGHPYDRHLELGSSLAAHILGASAPAFAIVDEGPGLSGSSFSAVAEWLVGNGIPRSAIHFFPSHLNGPGEQAPPERLRAWQETAQHSVTFNDLNLDEELAKWVSALVGPLVAPLSEFHEGRWRFLKAASAPAAPQWERRKYIAETVEGRWLVKFAGLGAMATRKLEVAQKLHAAGLGPEVAGLVHGFLVQRWVEAPSLLDAPVPEEPLVRHLASYLAFRSRLAAPADAGASAATLVEMAVHNTAEALGDAASQAMSRRLERTQAAEPYARVYIDGRLHRWEWLNSEGRLLKVDALDHALAHDFIGAQPIEWDIAGAIAEQSLEGSAKRLIEAFEAASGTTVDRGLLDFLTPCYVAFQLGSWTMALGPDDPTPQRYRAKLTAHLNS